jgi:hypothetical protein
MTYARKNLTSVMGAIAAVFVLAAISVWQFYLFASFPDGANVVTAPNGTGHLWWAVAMALFACGAAFLVFLVFVRRDSDDELHIASTRRA